ncbi:MAG: hypothetical protein ACR2J3_03680 [Aridibacter sp.]
MSNEHNAKYLLVGGYAVNYYGYVRPTGDMDIWIPFERENAEKIVQALKEFGFDSTDLTPELFLKPKSIIRMGVPPMRLEVSNYIDGVEFDDCYEESELLKLDDLNIKLISLKHLKINKKASGRLKDLNDLEHLP